MPISCNLPRHAAVGLCSGLERWRLEILGALEFGWSQDVLILQHEREGKDLTNFQRALPPSDSDWAEQIPKDPGNFDFLTVVATAKEQKIKRALTHLRDILLELGRGFSFVESQIPLNVDGQTSNIDPPLDLRSPPLLFRI